MAQARIEGRSKTEELLFWKSSSGKSFDLSNLETFYRHIQQAAQVKDTDGFKTEADPKLVKGFFQENPDFIPVGFTVQVAKKGADTFESIESISGGIGLRDPNYEDTLRHLTDQYPEFYNNPNPLDALAQFKKFVNAAQLKRFATANYQITSNYQITEFVAAVIELYAVALNKIGDLSKTKITMEIMDDPVAIALLETIRLEKVINSSASNAAKLDAIAYYQDQCKESWPSWLARLAIAVVCTAFGAIAGACIGSIVAPAAGSLTGAVAGGVAGALAADQLCRATFFAPQVCVFKVTTAALEKAEADEKAARAQLT